MSIIILTKINIDEFQYCVLTKILSSSHNVSAWIVDTKEPKSMMQKLKSNLKKGRGGFIIIMALRLISKKIFKKKDNSYNIEQMIKDIRVPVFFTDKLNSPEIINNIKSINADALVLLSGFGIIKKDILNICPFGVLSYHHGDMRKYRGQPPGFWELYNNEKEIGVTVQRLDEGLDCGEPVLERNFPIYYKDTLSSVRKRIFEGSTDMMLGSLDLIENEKPNLKKLSEYGKIYSLPNLRQWLAFNFKMLIRKINFLKQNKTIK